MRNRHLNKGRNWFALYCLSIPLLLIVVVHTCKSNYENIALSTDIELMLVLYLARKFGSERKEQHNLQREEISINNIHWFRRGLFFYFFTILMMKTVMITIEILFFLMKLRENMNQTSNPKFSELEIISRMFHVLVSPAPLLLKVNSNVF